MQRYDATTLAAAALCLALAACSEPTTAVTRRSGQGSGSSDLTLTERSHSRPTAFDVHRNAAPVGAQLQYYGGHVISNVKPVVVFWGPNVDATTQSTMPNFYETVVTSPYMDWLSEYDTPVDGGTGQSIGRGSYGGTYTITPNNASIALQDSDVQTEIGAQIDNGNLPAADANTIFMIHFPPGVSITMQGSTSCSAWCAYHGTFLKSGQDVFYAVMPDFSPGSPCQQVCGAYPNWIDELTSPSSHELIEAVTDAEVGLATTYAAPMAWMDPSNGEIGDICAYQLNGPLTAADGTVYNVQGMWSNSHNQCTFTGAAYDDYTVSPSTTAVSLAAGGSTTLQVSTAVVSGNADSLNLFAPGLPPGVTATFDTPTLTTGGTANLTLTADPSAPTSSAYFDVLAESATVYHQAFISISVTGGTGNDAGVPNDFSLALSPAAQTVSAGASTSFAVSTAVVSGVPETLSLSVAGLPAGATGSFDNASITTGGGATLTVAVAAGTAPSTTSFSVTAVGASANHAVAGTLTIGEAGSFSVSLSPPAQTVNQGGSVVFQVGTAVQSGAPGSLSLSVSGLPVGVTASFDNTVIQAGGSAMLTLGTTASTPTGAATFTVTAQGSAETATAQASLTIYSLVPVSFEVDNATTYFGQNVYLVGNTAQLGSWVPQQGVLLSPSNYPSWTSALDMAPGQQVQFKFVKLDGSGNVVWEGGNNRTLTIPNEAVDYVTTWQQ